MVSRATRVASATAHGSTRSAGPCRPSPPGPTQPGRDGGRPGDGTTPVPGASRSVSMPQGTERGRHRRVLSGGRPTQCGAEGRRNHSGFRPRCRYQREWLPGGAVSRHRTDRAMRDATVPGHGHEAPGRRTGRHHGPGFDDRIDAGRRVGRRAHQGDRPTSRGTGHPAPSAHPLAGRGDGRPRRRVGPRPGGDHPGPVRCRRGPPHDEHRPRLAAGPSGRRRSHRPELAQRGHPGRRRPVGRRGGPGRQRLRIPPVERLRRGRLAGSRGCSQSTRLRRSVRTARARTPCTWVPATPPTRTRVATSR